MASLLFEDWDQGQQSDLLGLEDGTRVVHTGGDADRVEALGRLYRGVAEVRRQEREGEVRPIWSLLNPVGTERVSEQSVSSSEGKPFQPVAFWGGEPVSQAFKDKVDLGTNTAMGFVGSTNLPSGFRSYHGSPHSFERFDSSRIGTGEGAQAYGHGLYFAEQEGTAKAYRDALAQKATIDGDQVLVYAKDHGAPPDALRALEHTKGNVDEAVAFLGSMKGSMPALDAGIQKDMDWLIANKGRLGFNPGHMYEVNINAPPEHFLDWDRPLKDQPEALKKIEALVSPDMLKTFQFNVDRGITGGNAYHNYIGSNPAASSQALREAGIPGIRYFDAGSRRTPTWDIGEGVTGADRNDLRAAMDYAIRNNIRGDTPHEIAAALRKTPQTGYAAIVRKYADQINIRQPSRNTVVFDDSIIDVLRKYGIAGLMLGGATAAGASRE